MNGVKTKAGKGMHQNQEEVISVAAMSMILPFMAPIHLSVST